VRAAAAGGPLTCRRMKRFHPVQRLDLAFIVGNTGSLPAEAIGSGLPGDVQPGAALRHLYFPIGSGSGGKDQAVSGSNIRLISRRSFLRLNPFHFIKA